MIRNYCSMTTMSIHGGIGKVANANFGFIFLPFWLTDTMGSYWTSTPLDNEQEAYFFETSEYYLPIDFGDRTVPRAVRAIAN